MVCDARKLHTTSHVTSMVRAQTHCYSILANQVFSLPKCTGLSLSYISPSFSAGKAELARHLSREKRGKKNSLEKKRRGERAFNQRICSLVGLPPPPPLLLFASNGGRRRCC